MGKVKYDFSSFSELDFYRKVNTRLIELAEVDKLYIENKSIFMDFLILLGTFVRFPKNYLIKLIT